MVNILHYCTLQLGQNPLRYEGGEPWPSGWKGLGLGRGGRSEVQVFKFGLEVQVMFQSVIHVLFVGSLDVASNGVC